MHEVHTFVSSCPGIDATVAAELLNHLLECMPLNEDRLHGVLMDLMSDTSRNEALCGLTSPGGRSLSCGSSTTSTEDLCSDLDEAESSTEHVGGVAYAQAAWRPW